MENCPLTRWSAWSSGWGARRGEERARSWQAWLGPTGHEILGVWEHPAPQRWPLRAQEKYFRFKTCLAMAAKQGSAATNAAGTRQTSRSGGSGGGRTSGSGEPGGSAPVNVFQDHERAAGRFSTKAELFKKLDALVYPGRPAKEKTDNMPASERFAMCAAGMHGGASGFKRMSTLRTKTDVKREYDTLLSYQCATCSKNRACNLALRPPVDHMRLFVPGKERVARGEGITYHMVFKEDHALHLERAGFTQVQVEFHAPDLELNGFDALPEQGGASSSKRRRSSGPRVADSGGASGGQPRARSPDAAAEARERALQTLQMPVDVPTWTSCKQLAAMMEEPFETHTSPGTFNSPVYMWPRGKAGGAQRKLFGAAWAQSKSSDALSKLYQDYYNLVARKDETIQVLRDHPNAKLKQRLAANKDVLGADDLPAGVTSHLRSCMLRPSQHSDWAAAVVAYIRSIKGENFKEPFT